MRDVCFSRPREQYLRTRTSQWANNINTLFTNFLFKFDKWNNSVHISICCRQNLKLVWLFLGKSHKYLLPSPVISQCNGVLSELFLCGSWRNHWHWNTRVMQHIVTNTSQKCPSHSAKTPTAHYNVVCFFLVCRLTNYFPWFANFCYQFEVVLFCMEANLSMLLAHGKVNREQKQTNPVIKISWFCNNIDDHTRTRNC